MEHYREYAVEPIARATPKTMIGAETAMRTKSEPATSTEPATIRRSDAPTNERSSSTSESYQ